MTASDNNLTRAVIRSGSGTVCTLLYKGEKVSFPTKAGKDYTVVLADGKLTLAD